MRGNPRGSWMTHFNLTSRTMEDQLPLTSIILPRNFNTLATYCEELTH